MGQQKMLYLDEHQELLDSEWAVRPMDPIVKREDCFKIKLGRDGKAQFYMFDSDTPS